MEKKYSDVEVEAHKSAGDRIRLFIYTALTIIGFIIIWYAIVVSIFIFKGIEIAGERMSPFKIAPVITSITVIIMLLIGGGLVAFGIHKRRTIKKVIAYKIEKSSPEFDKGDWVASKRKERKDIHIKIDK